MASPFDPPRVSREGQGEVERGWLREAAQGAGLPVGGAATFARLALVARQGDAGAQYTKGLCYIHANGVRHDATAGRAWLERAAGQGLLVAKSALLELQTEWAVGRAPVRAKPRRMSQAEKIDEMTTAYPDRPPPKGASFTNGRGMFTFWASAKETDLFREGLLLTLPETYQTEYRTYRERKVTQPRRMFQGEQLDEMTTTHPDRPPPRGTLFSNGRNMFTFWTMAKESDRFGEGVLLTLPATYQTEYRAYRERKVAKRRHLGEGPLSQLAEAYQDNAKQFDDTKPHKVADTDEFGRGQLSQRPSAYRNQRPAVRAPKVVKTTSLPGDRTPGDRRGGDHTPVGHKRRVATLERASKRGKPDGGVQGSNGCGMISPGDVPVRTRHLGDAGGSQPAEECRGEEGANDAAHALVALSAGGGGEARLTTRV